LANPTLEAAATFYKQQVLTAGADKQPYFQQPDNSGVLARSQK